MTGVALTSINQHANRPRYFTKENTEYNAFFVYRILYESCSSIKPGEAKGQWRPFRNV